MEGLICARVASGGGAGGVRTEYSEIAARRGWRGIVGRSRAATYPATQVRRTSPEFVARVPARAGMMV